LYLVLHISCFNNHKSRLFRSSYFKFDRVIIMIIILQSFLAAGSKYITKSPDYALLDDWLKTGLLIRFGRI
jgi:hypothetical protein